MVRVVRKSVAELQIARSNSISQRLNRLSTGVASPAPLAGARSLDWANMQAAAARVELEARAQPPQGSRRGSVKFGEDPPPVGPPGGGLSPLDTADRVNADIQSPLVSRGGQQAGDRGKDDKPRSTY